MACHIRRDDQVVVLAGNHKGKRGKVLRVAAQKGLVWIEGVNMVYRHVKPSRRNPQGGRLQKEAPVHISNVLPVHPKTNRPTRVRFETDRDASGRTTAKRRVTVAEPVMTLRELKHAPQER